MRSVIAVLIFLTTTASAYAQSWKSDPIWYDGLVEKAVYDSTRVIYGQPRRYEMIAFTNKEQHDVATLTKANTSKKTLEVFKHNHIEVVPTPNYEYKFTTTTHLTTDRLGLTRLDAGCQEFCGTSFKQYHWTGDVANPGWEYRAFSYMPEEGHVVDRVAERGDGPVVAEDSLPLWLRDFDFAARQPVKLRLIPSQKSNRNVEHKPVDSEVRFEAETADAYELVLLVEGKERGRFWMAKDRLHVMTAYKSADGTEHRLKSLDRVDYWSRSE